jgi:protocatechuate 3,4-dioxygenase beta subunit
VAAWIALWIGFQAQQPHGLISGVLVDDEGAGRPVRRALVTLTSADGAVRRTVTSDDRGRFAVPDLFPARYLIEASKLPYLNAAYGAKAPGRAGAAIALAAEQHITDLTLRMTRGAAIAGTVRGIDGMPIRGVIVTASRFAWLNGQRILKAAGSTGAITDERGRYRVYALPPSDYVVAAVVGSVLREDDVRAMQPGEVQRTVQDARTGISPGALPPLSLRPMAGVTRLFYPDASDPAGAATIRLDAREERTNIDIQFVLVPTARLAGVITGPDGAPQAAVEVTATSQASIAMSGVVAEAARTGRTDAAGRYAISGLPPGMYSVAASSGNERSIRWASAEVLITGDDVTLPLTMTAGMKVAGHLVFDGAKPSPAQLSELRVGLFKAFESNRVGSPIAITPAGRFLISDLTPGRYALSQRAGTTASTWQLRSATVDGLDVLNLPMEVRPGQDIADVVLTFTDQPSQLSGSLVDTSGRAVSDYFIVVFPTDRARWIPGGRQARQARPTSAGSYSVANLPAGEYYVSVLTDVEPGDWDTPEVLAGLVSAAVRVMIGDRQTTIQNLTVGR